MNDLLTLRATQDFLLKIVQLCVGNLLVPRSASHVQELDLRVTAEPDIRAASKDVSERDLNRRLY